MADRFICYESHFIHIRLPAIYPASECPSTIRISTVVHKSVLTEEAFATECLHIYHDSISRRYRLHFRTHLLDYAHHLMADSYSWHGTRNAAMLDVQITAADTGECNPHDGILRLLQFRFRLVHKLKTALLSSFRQPPSLEILIRAPQPHIPFPRECGQRSCFCCRYGSKEPRAYPSEGFP